MTQQEVLVYAYGIVEDDAPDPPPELTGIDGASVRLVRVEDVAAIVSDVDALGYSDEALNARLDDLTWVGERGLAHERVLDWFSERGPVIPLSLFSLHRDVDRLRDRIGRESRDLSRTLDRLRGRREWGVRLWRREAEAREGVDRLSVSLRKLSEEIESAPQGRRFLLERKREAMRAEEVRAVSKRIAHEIFDLLRRSADDARTLPIASPQPGAETTLLLHSAFLVTDSGLDAFRRILGEQAGGLTDTGFELELTGPWPPYHFADSE